jgi:hypothetical protein
MTWRAIIDSLVTHDVKVDVCERSNNHNELCDAVSDSQETTPSLFIRLHVGGNPICAYITETVVSVQGLLSGTTEQDLMPQTTEKTSIFAAPTLVSITDNVYTV